MTSTAMGLSPDQIERAYSDLKNLIYKLTHNFQRRYGGDFDELLSEAHMHFLRACDNYDPERGAKLITVVYHYVRNGLNRSRQKPRVLRGAPPSIRRENVQLERIPDHQRQRGLVRLQEELSEDAQAIVRLTLTVNGQQIKHKRRQIVDFLCEYGWCAREVVRSFREIREVL